jgi:YD repeat-containing protein
MQTVRVASQTSGDQQTTYTWCEDEPGCPAGSLRSVTSPMQAVTTYLYNEENGTPTATVQPNGTRSLVTYDLRGCLLESTSPDGIRTVYTYNDAGGLQGDCAPTQVIENPAGTTDKRVTAFQYDPARNTIVRTSDVGGGRTNSDTEAMFRHRVVTPDGGTAIVLARDGGSAGTGFVTSQQMSYDPHGQAVLLTDVAMNRSITRTFAYAGDGTLTVTSQRSGIPAASTETFDASGQVVQTVDPRGVTSTRSYNANSGRLEVEVAGAAPVPSHAAANLVTPDIATDNDTAHDPQQSSQAAWSSPNDYRLYSYRCLDLRVT